VSRPGRALLPVPIAQEVGWTSEVVWTQRQEEKSFASVGDLTPVVQSVVRHYTDWATSVPNNSRQKVSTIYEALYYTYSSSPVILLLLSLVQTLNSELCCRTSQSLLSTLSDEGRVLHPPKTSDKITPKKKLQKFEDESLDPTTTRCNSRARFNNGNYYCGSEQL
jgi:hypothetical protein